MKNKFFAELSRRLCIDGIESSAIEDKRLEVFLHGRPVLSVSPASDVFLLPAGNKSEETSELYHQVAVVADEVHEYMEAVQNAPLLHTSGLHEDFRLLANFGGAVLAGQERKMGRDTSSSPGSGTTTAPESATATTLKETFRAPSRTSPSAPA